MFPVTFNNILDFPTCLYLVISNYSNLSFFWSQAFGFCGHQHNWVTVETNTSFLHGFPLWNLSISYLLLVHFHKNRVILLRDVSGKRGSKSKRKWNPRSLLLKGSRAEDFATRYPIFWKRTRCLLLLFLKMWFRNKCSCKFSKLRIYNSFL